MTYDQYAQSMRETDEPYDRSIQELERELNDDGMLDILEMDFNLSCPVLEGRSES